MRAMDIRPPLRDIKVRRIVLLESVEVKVDEKDSNDKREAKVLVVKSVKA
jgi:hypothetical protein